jgi:hypothetical protein
MAHIIVVDKGGSLKSLIVKDFKEEELYKKCGFKKAEGFALQTEWPIKLNGQRYVVAMYGKLDGKANMENKYDWPPPVDKNLYFGSCCLVGMVRDDANNRSYIHLSLELWEKMYEKLFGGFEDLAVMGAEDEDEEDELEAIPASKKTKKGGYLKDGFVVDSSETEDDSTYSDDDDDDDDEEEESEEVSGLDEEMIIADIGSELSEESYDYSDDDDK